MSLKSHTSVLLQGARFALASLALLQFSVLGPLTSPAQAQEMPAARTPIKHVIIIVGENRSFDHIFATYKPVTGEKVDNLLSKHIVTEEGTPDVGFGAAAQYSADECTARCLRHWWEGQRQHRFRQSARRWPAKTGWIQPITFF